MDNSMQAFSIMDLQEISEELENVPHLSEKMLVDLVNGQEMSKDLIESKRNQGTFGCLIGALDGSNRRREGMIEAQTQRSLETLTSWTLDLTDSVRLTQENLKLVSDKLQATRQDILSVAKAVCRDHAAIKNLEQTLLEIDHKLSQRILDAERRLLTVEDKQDILEVTEGWMSGRFYRGYPLAIQATFVIDDLLRGERGQRIFNNKQALGFLQDRIINIMLGKSDTSIDSLQSLTDQWLPHLVIDSPMRRELAVYGLRQDGNRLLHDAMASTIEAAGAVPEWIEASQDSGDIPALLDVSDFTYEITREAAKCA